MEHPIEFIHSDNHKIEYKKFFIPNWLPFIGWNNRLILFEARANFCSDRPIINATIYVFVVKGIIFLYISIFKKNIFF